MSVSDDALVVAIALSISLAAVVGVLEQALLGSIVGWVYVPVVASFSATIQWMFLDSVSEDLPTANREADA